MPAFLAAGVLEAPYLKVTENKFVFPDGSTWELHSNSLRRLQPPPELTITDISIHNVGIACIDGNRSLSHNRPAFAPPPFLAGPARPEDGSTIVDVCADTPGFIFKAALRWRGDLAPADHASLRTVLDAVLKDVKLVRGREAVQAPQFTLFNLPDSNVTLDANTGDWSFVTDTEPNVAWLVPTWPASQNGIKLSLRQTSAGCSGAGFKPRSEPDAWMQPADGTATGACLQIGKNILVAEYADPTTLQRRERARRETLLWRIRDAAWRPGRKAAEAQAQVHAAEERERMAKAAEKADQQLRDQLRLPSLINNGMRLLAQGKAADAEFELRAALAIDPKNKEATRGLARSLGLKSPPDVDGAVRSYWTLVTGLNAPEHAREFVDFLFEINQPESAVSVASTLHAQRIYGATTLAAVYARAGKYEDAWALVSFLYAEKARTGTWPSHPPSKEVATEYRHRAEEQKRRRADAERGKFDPFQLDARRALLAEIRKELGRRIVDRTFVQIQAMSDDERVAGVRKVAPAIREGLAAAEPSDPAAPDDFPIERPERLALMQSCEQGELDDCILIEGYLQRRAAGPAKVALPKKTGAALRTLYQVRCAQGYVSGCQRIGDALRSQHWGLKRNADLALGYDLMVCEMRPKECYLAAISFSFGKAPLRALQLHEMACKGGQSASCKEAAWLREHNGNLISAK